ncbi:MAG: replicative DNA helicase [Thermotogae bacterium]|nr:replicative DNA helicase [Thermotogota bacterium]
MQEVKLPHNLDAEMSVLSACLYKPDLLARAIVELTEEDFYDPRHRILFAAMRNLYAETPAVDGALLLEYLKKRNLIDKVGGLPYLAEIFDRIRGSISPALFEQHLRILRDKSIKRGIINTFSETIRLAYEDELDADTILDRAEKEIFDIRMRTLKSAQWVPVGQVAMNLLNRLEDKLSGKLPPEAVLTGFSRLDAITGGFRPGEWVIVAARPSVGKTAFVLNIHRNMALEGIPTAMFSLEMTAESLAMRLLALESNIPMHVLREGNIKTKDLPRIAEAVDRMMEMPFYIDVTHGIDIFEIRSKARMVVQEYGVRMISIDYLQLMDLRGGRGRNMTRAEELAKISRSLKILAGELGVAIVGISQVSREVEKRADKKPTMADLRESGALEQDADIILLLYRPGQYDKEADETLVEVEVAKNRQGSQGTVKLHFYRDYMKFVDWTEEDESIEEVENDMPF